METIILNNNIKLVPMKSELYHRLKINYVADEMMCDETYVYNKESAQKIYENKIKDEKRRWFAILLNSIVIGDVYFKNIDFIKKTATLSIALTQDIYKGKGYGTAVEKAMLDYGIYRLNLQTIYADTVLRNTRSEHVLKKVGFKYISEDNNFKYYRYISDCK